MTDPVETGRPAPLAGVRVVDLTQVVSGAVTTSLLAQFGADVIKVEPRGGEAYRRSGYPLVTDAGETNLNFIRFSRGKRSVVLDLKTPEGSRALERMLEQADVLVENFRPGVLERLGFGAERLRRDYPELIYTSVSGFGHDDLYPSPMPPAPAYAIVCEAMAGIMDLAGDPDGPPVWLGFAMADIFSGTLAFAGTLLALRERDGDRRGRRVDISMYDGSLLMNELALTYHSVVGENMSRGSYTLQAPWGAYPTTDGWAVVAVLSEDQWKLLCRTIGHEELAEHPQLRDGRSRSAHERTLIRPVLSAWTSARTRSQVVAELSAAGVPAAPVNTAADVAASEQAAAREMFVEAEDPVLGLVRLVGNPIKVEGVRPPDRMRIPALGQHTREVLEELGFTPDEIDELEGVGAR